MYSTFVKLTGGGVMIFAAFMWGRSRAADERKKAVILEEFISFVRFVNEHISRLRLPLCEIFARYEPESGEMREFILEARSRGIREAWERKAPPLPDNAVPVCSRFVSELGESYVEEECGRCGYTVSALGEIRDGIKKDLSQRCRMWCFIPPLAVSSVLLILL